MHYQTLSSLRGAPFTAALPAAPRSSTATRLARHGEGRVCAGKRNFGEKLSAELLDVVTGGPKMRKWYGQESNAVPKDGGEGQEQERQQPQEASRGQQQQQQAQEQYDGPRDVVLVTDADTPTGELVTLQLILLRAAVRVLVRETAAAKAGYGPYVDPVSVDMNSSGGLARALRGVKTVIAVGPLGALLPAAKAAGVERLVLLSTAGMPQPGGLGALFQNGADSCLKDPQREAAVAASGIPAIIVKTGGIIRDEPGGSSSLAVLPAAGGAPAAPRGGGGGSITREDLASALVAGAVSLPAFGTSNSSGSGGASQQQQQQLVFQVQDAGPGSPPENWEQLLEGIAVSAQ